MGESNDVHRDLADQTNKGKTDLIRFLPWLIVLVMIVFGMLWIRGMRTSDQAQEQTLGAEKAKVPVVRTKKVSQPTEAPKPVSETISTEPEPLGTLNEINDSIPDKTPSTSVVTLEGDLAAVKEPPPTPPGDKPASSKIPPIEIENFPYSLHMGSYKTLIMAEKYMGILKNKGLAPYWVVVDLREKGVWYRVFLGNFMTFDQADAFQTQHEIKADRIINTKYAVQIGMYSSKEALDQRRFDVRKAGYCPYTIEQARGQYQLLMGAFQTKKAAERLAVRLKDSGIEGHAILR